MKHLLRRLLEPATPKRVENALCFLRIGIGVIIFFHGIPKMMGGMEMWNHLGMTFMVPLGIQFLPTFWGFLGAATEFFGGIALVFGLGTRIASACLTVMMVIAAAWHIQRGDSFNIYSFPLTLIVVFVVFILIGSGNCSADRSLIKKIR